MSENQNDQATPEQTKTIAGLGVMLASLLAATQGFAALAPIVKPLAETLASCQRALENVTSALVQHRENMMRQQDAFDSGVEKLCGAFGRFDEQAKHATRAITGARDAYREASGALRDAAAFHREATGEHTQARQEIGELKALLSILVQREGLNVTPTSSGTH